jgi:ribosome-binding factor A
MPLGGDHAGEVITELSHHVRAIRGELGRRITLKFTPSLTFRIDPSFDEADRIESLLQQPRVARDLAGGDDGDNEEDAVDTEETERG